MKYKITTTLLTLVLVSCGNYTPSEVSTEGYVNALGENREVRFQTVTIDSCEYISNNYIGGDAGVLSHKGNCKFCRARFFEALEKRKNK